jgi:hypothetical protein
MLSIIILSVVILSGTIQKVVMLSVIMPSVIMLGDAYAEYRHAECQGVPQLGSFKSTKLPEISKQGSLTEGEGLVQLISSLR